MKILHRRLWQSLPRTWRRNALQKISLSIAPRPDAAKPAHPVIVAGYLTAASGLGMSARLCHDALCSRGIETLGVDLTRQFRQDDAPVDFAFADASSYLGPATVILHINSPLVPLAMLFLGRRFVAEKYFVGYWAWELPRAPNEWASGTRFVDRIFVPSQFTASAVSALNPAMPVDVLPHPVCLNGAQPALSDTRNVFNVLTVFNMASGFSRKNPIAAIRAFKLAFGDHGNVRLTVKVQNAGSYPPGMTQLRHEVEGASTIDLNTSNLDWRELLQLYENSDALLSLHRAEGFGLSLAEAMLAGCVVISTDWSGNQDFMNAQTGVPIPYRLIPARDPQGVYEHPDMCWADPDVDAAASVLRTLYADPSMRRRLGLQAREYAREHFSAGAYTRRLLDLLGLPENPAAASSDPS